MHGFMAAVIRADFFSLEGFKNQNILIVGGTGSLRKDGDGNRLYDAEYLRKYALANGAKSCVCGILAYEDTLGLCKREYNGSILEVSDCYKERCFDRIVILSGLEFENNPLMTFKHIYKLLKKGGELDVFFQTPKTNFVKYAVSEYEHIWRFTLEDIEEIFYKDFVKKIVVEESGDFYALEVEKLDEELYINDNMKLFSFYHQAYVNPNDFKKDGYFSRYRELDDIGKYVKTDKNKFEHNYLNKYEFFFNPWKDRSFSLLELGIFRGGSAQMWEQYFRNATIHCVDVMPQCEQFETKRIKTHIMDLGNIDNLYKLRYISPEIIIDDASHLWRHQILALFTLFPALPSGGIYILEDLETSVNQEIYKGYDDGSPVDAYTVCERIARVTASKVPECKNDIWSADINMIGMETEMVSIIRGSCIIIKK